MRESRGQYRKRIARNFARIAPGALMYEAGGVATKEATGDAEEDRKAAIIKAINEKKDTGGDGGDGGEERRERDRSAGLAADWQRAQDRSTNPYLR